MTEKWIVDDAGTLINMSTRNHYDYMEEVVDVLNNLSEENEQLKKELTKFKEWENYVGDIKREELDRVFKMSIYELADAFEYYKKRIKELQQTIDTIAKDYEESHGMDIRNAEWFTAW